MKLDKETRKRLIASIRRYADEELELDMGELKASLLLDYIVEEVGPSVYNAAIRDARAYFFAKVEDLEGTCWEDELPYWPQRDRSGRGENG